MGKGTFHFVDYLLVKSISELLIFTFSCKISVGCENNPLASTLDRVPFTVALYTDMDRCENAPERTEQKI